MKLKRSKLDLLGPIIILVALFAVGLRSEDRELSIADPDIELFWSGSTIDTIQLETGPESISAKLSEAEGKTLQELEGLVKELGARLKLAQETHDQELRRIGAVKFPSQFGLAGKLDTLKDFSEIRWSPRTPSCQSIRFQGEWFSGITSNLGTLETTTELTDVPSIETTTLEWTH